MTTETSVSDLTIDDFDEAQERLSALSEWIDASNAHRDAEAVLWGRVAKIGEEHGEAIQTLIAWTGQNPRKPRADYKLGRDALVAELLDVAITALGAIEHVRGHDRSALTLLAHKIDAVHNRALGDAR